MEDIFIDKLNERSTSDRQMMDEAMRDLSGMVNRQKKAKGEEERYLLGMEESYGYLSGTHARDKDAVNASMLVIEMAAYYKTQGKTLVDVMNELYERYGMYRNSLFNFGFEGADGMMKMNAMMEDMRTNAPASIGGLSVLVRDDYLRGLRIDTESGSEQEITLPRSNVLSYSLANGSKVVVRPSGTEPKIKIYITAHTDTQEEACELTEKMLADMKSMMGIEA